MIHGFYFGRLSIRTTGVAGPQYFEFTIELPRVDVYATTALTGVSLGMLQGAPGMANAYIKRHGHINSSGSLEHFSPPANDVFFNSVYIPQCVYVNFRLAATQAEAGMQGTVWVMSPTPSNNRQENDQENAQNRQRRDVSFQFVDEQGQPIGSQSYSLLSQDSQLDLSSSIAAYRTELAHNRLIAPESITVNQIDPLPAPVVQWAGR